MACYNEILLATDKINTIFDILFDILSDTINVDLYKNYE